MAASALKKKDINTSHAWKGTWNRPMKLDEDSLDAFTVARMTDHNVRGSDDPDEPQDPESPPENPDDRVEKTEDLEVEKHNGGQMPTLSSPWDDKDYRRDD